MDDRITVHLNNFDMDGDDDEVIDITDVAGAAGGSACNTGGAAVGAATPNAVEAATPQEACMGDASAAEAAVAGEAAAADVGVEAGVISGVPAAACFPTAAIDSFTWIHVVSSEMRRGNRHQAALIALRSTSRATYADVASSVPWYLRRSAIGMLDGHMIEVPFQLQGSSAQLQSHGDDEYYHSMKGRVRWDSPDRQFHVTFSDGRGFRYESNAMAFLRCTCVCAIAPRRCLYHTGNVSKSKLLHTVVHDSRALSRVCVHGNHTIECARDTCVAFVSQFGDQAASVLRGGDQASSLGRWKEVVADVPTCIICLQHCVGVPRFDNTSAAWGFTSDCCGHSFHRICMIKWVRQEGLVALGDEARARRMKCPVCSKQLCARTHNLQTVRKITK